MDNKDKSIYALLADNVYWDVRKGGTDVDIQAKSNWTPVPDGWTPVPDGWTVIGKYDESGSGINHR